MKKLIIILLGLFWVLFGTGCETKANGRTTVGFEMTNSFLWTTGSGDKGPSSFTIKSTLVDNIVGGLFPGEVGPPAPEPEGP